MISLILSLPLSITHCLHDVLVAEAVAEATTTHTPAAAEEDTAAVEEDTMIEVATAAVAAEEEDTIVDTTTAEDTEVAAAEEATVAVAEEATEVAAATTTAMVAEATVAMEAEEAATNFIHTNPLLHFLFVEVTPKEENELSMDNLTWLDRIRPAVRKVAGRCQKITAQ